MKRCVIFAAAPIGSADYIKINEDDMVICADAGILHAKRLNIEPDLVLGDFDSCDKNEAEDYMRVTFPKRKDDTDLMLAVKYGMQSDCDEFMIYGALGGDRLDHTVAAFSALSFLKDNGIKAILEDEKTIIELLEVGTHNIIRKGKYLSLFPFGCDRVPVSLKGTSYDGDALLMASFPLGVSNEIIEESAEITIHQGDCESRVLAIQIKS